MLPTPDWLDRSARFALALPARTLDRFDRRLVQIPVGEPGTVYPLVRRHAQHPEAYLALEPGLHHHVYGGAVLAWKRHAGTAFAIGGLNAPTAARSGLLRSFVDVTTSAGVTRQMLFPVRRHELDDVRAAGFDTVPVGVDSWLDLEHWTLSGGRRATLRHMRRRGQRAGLAVGEVDVRDAGSALRDTYGQWLLSKRPSWRMRLLVGSPGFHAPYDRRFFAAGSEGRIDAFVTVVPAGDRRWGIDVMCRRPDAPVGAMEHLIVTTIEALRDEGAAALSLGPCPMAGIASSGPRPLLRAVFRSLYGTAIGNRIFGFRGLHQFKAKFRPRWEPIWIAARPRVTVGALYAGCRMWGLY